MPVILDPDGYDLWLDPGMNDVAAASDLLKPCDARLMRCYPVSTRINHAACVGSSANSRSAPTETDHMSFTDSPLIRSRFARDSKADDSAFERAVLTSTLTRSLVEEFFRKYLKGDSAPHLDVITHVDRK
jgi:hypothetical protein